MRWRGTGVWEKVESGTFMRIEDTRGYRFCVVRKECLEDLSPLL